MLLLEISKSQNYKTTRMKSDDSWTLNSLQLCVVQFYMYVSTYIQVLLFFFFLKSSFDYIATYL